MIRVSIDGRQLEMPEGIAVLAALGRAGIHVPQLCHDERLAPAGVCRLDLHMRSGHLFATFHTPSTFTNAVRLRKPASPRHPAART